MEENKMWNVPNILKFKKPEVQSKEIEIKEVDTRVNIHTLYKPVSYTHLRAHET